MHGVNMHDMANMIEMCVVCGEPLHYCKGQHNEPETIPPARPARKRTLPTFPDNTWKVQYPRPDGVTNHF